MYRWVCWYVDVPMDIRCIFYIFRVELCVILTDPLIINESKPGATITPEIPYEDVRKQNTISLKKEVLYPKNLIRHISI